MIPEIGSWVIITRGTTAWASDMDKYIGLVLKLQKDCSMNAFHNMPRGMCNFCWTFGCGHFREATTQERNAHFSSEFLKLKEGDRVILEVDDGWTPDMSRFKDREATVTSVRPIGFSVNIGEGYVFKGFSLLSSKYKDGDSYNFESDSGYLKKNGEEFSWHYYSSRRANDFMFDEKDLRITPFFQHVLGYSFDNNTSGGFPYCRCPEDVVKLLTAVSNYNPGNNPEVEVEDSYQGNDLSSEVDVNGYKCTYESDSDGIYSYYLAGDSDELLIDLEKSINRYTFQQQVLGYVGPKNFDFPQCKTFRDLILFTNALRNKVKGKDDLLGSDIYINGYSGTINQRGEHYEWDNSQWCHNTIFKEWTVDKYNFQERVLGYTLRIGDFPLCRSTSDVVTLCSAITNENNKRKQATLPEQSTELILGSEISLQGFSGVLCGGRGEWFWASPETSNDAPFQKMGVDKLAFQQQILGYSGSSGDFPYCRTLGDLIRFCKAIQAYPSPRVPEAVSTQACGSPFQRSVETTDIPIIFINVPKI